MFAEWVTTCVQWGIIIASAAFTLFIIAMMILGFFSAGARWLRGGRDEKNNTQDKDDDDFFRPSKPA